MKSNFDWFCIAVRGVLSLTSISNMYTGLFNKKHYLHISLVLWEVCLVRNTIYVFIWCFGHDVFNALL